MVQVACTAEVVTLVVGRRQSVTVTCCPCSRGAVVVIGTDVSRLDLVILAVEAAPLIGEGEPSACCRAVVEHHVGDDAGAERLIGTAHRAKFGGATEGTAVCKPILWVIAHGRAARGFTALGHPDEAEELRQLVGLLGERLPSDAFELLLDGVFLCLRVAGRLFYPVETLQHDAGIIGGPALAEHRQGAHRHEDQCV